MLLIAFQPLHQRLNRKHAFDPSVTYIAGRIHKLLGRYYVAVADLGNFDAVMRRAASDSVGAVKP